MKEKLHSIEVNEAETVASLISTCEAQFQQYFASYAIRVLKDQVDLATLQQTATLADADIDKTTVLNVEETHKQQ